MPGAMGANQTKVTRKASFLCSLRVMTRRASFLCSLRVIRDWFGLVGIFFVHDLLVVDGVFDEN